jgi:hypothetical protein
METDDRLTCGCCTQGCVCTNHQDTPNGLPPHTCAAHRPFEAGDFVLYTDTTLGKAICVVGKVTKVDGKHVSLRGFIVHPACGSSEHDWMAYPEELVVLTAEQYEEAHNLTPADRKWIAGWVSTITSP